MGVKYVNIISKTFTMLRVSSKRIKSSDRESPKPATRSARKKPTKITSGKVNAIDWPEI